MEYFGYIGRFSYDPDIKMFAGSVANARAIGTFYGKTLDELKKAFYDTVDYYLDVCKRKGVEPEKPFSFSCGFVNARSSSELNIHA